MEFLSRTTRSANFDQIIAELTNALSGEYDLAFLFMAPAGDVSLQEVAKTLRDKIPIKNLLACTAAGIIGNENEIEYRSATVLILGKLPQVKFLPFMLNQTQLSGFKTKEDWYNYFEIFPNENPIFIALPDPFEFDTQAFLEGVNFAYPDTPVLGGLASAASQPGENVLIVNNEVRSDGMVGVVLTGDLRVEAVVSQGCRPIGATFIITKAEGNMIHTLAGQPFLDVLKEILEDLPDYDRALAQEAIFVGIAMNEYTDQFKRGDFLVRGLIGVDSKTKAGIIAEYVKPGQTVQFHLRDAVTAKEDLNEMLTFEPDKSKPKGALVFCCNGRGINLFKEKDHDIKIIQNRIGPVPAAGFFCAGEIGPVGKDNYLHGFTNSIALFYPRET